ncbi:hypothetical protein C0033_06955 [Clostridium sp. chh4-2]|uniref:AAA domain-containing protein n=1 Tax=Clostridium sp. chh4-2 TaxID=2067550 RepID=UPI000CCF842D|nr:AAA domain-containing protein [Clostridium sp. chh4-2]PNV62757.1 hypothetical protein C0033_06955 [Clostridium sp. chh4-2]
MKETSISKKQKIAVSILDYWHTLEFLSQDALPTLTYEEKRKNKEAVKMDSHTNELSSNNASNVKILKMITPLERSSDLLDTVRQETERHGMACWGNITVYAGKSKRELCIQKIAQALHEEDNRPESNHDEIAWFGLQLSAFGSYVEGSFSLSTIIWALNRIEKLADESLLNCLSEDDYKKDLEEFDDYLKREIEIGKGHSLCDSCKYQGEEGSFSPVNTDQIYHLYNKIVDKYVKRILQDKKDDVGKVQDQETSGEFSCILVYQIYKDEETREKYRDDDYSGLGKTFFADDLKMVLTKIKSGEFGDKNPMQESLIAYIVGAYNEYYPEAWNLSRTERFDLGWTPDGNKNRNALQEKIADVLDVRNAPIGKWPSRFMPSLMQQMAVNLAVRESEEIIPIFSVNGPPGTGKTTLLKEIIVHNIIMKAELLAKYQKPDDAFKECCFKYGEKRNNGYSNWYSKYYRLRNEKINDYSILVTSCNNSAVENITKELPVETGITEALNPAEGDSQMFKEQLSEVKRLFTSEESECYEMLYCKDEERSGVYKDLYFTEYAKELLGDDKAWGLISVALGKKSNIHRFYQTVLCHLDADFYKTEKIEYRLEEYQKIRKKFLKQKEKVEWMQKELVRNCQDEKKFREYCIQKRIDIQEENQKIEEKICLLEDSDQMRADLKVLLKEEERKLSCKEDELVKVGERWEFVKKQWNEIVLLYTKKRKESIAVRKNISIVNKILHTKNAKAKINLADKLDEEVRNIERQKEEKESEYQQQKLEYEKLNQEIEMQRQRLKDLEKKQKSLDENIASAPNDIEKCNLKIRQCESELTEATQKYRTELAERLEKADDVSLFTALDEHFMEQLLSCDEKENAHAQVLNLWFTNSYNREREKMFYYALQLNKAFILSSKSCFRNYRNLALLWQETKDDNAKVCFHPKDREACLGPLLQSLFLLVPVVSTTFASVGMFLRDIKEPNVIGTLIVDEAGQAPPQMAVGALYRCRKSVIVGDPKQIEPVVTDDIQLLKKVYKNQCYKPYKSKRVSVQLLADIINPYGTYMENENMEKEWVGCPLVVHRRCISPMYEISNSISYNNTMKQQTKEPSQKNEELFCYPGSRWINVIGSEAGNKNHYVEAQGKRTLEILELAFSKSDNPSLFIITPFTTVKAGMVKCIEDHIRQNKNSVLFQKQNNVKEWMYRSIGTVHTFQGKEANEVIFLLGCDAGKEAKGAVKWVNSNIVNVAVTRAKYRLYVIGDERAWKESLFISQMKRIIDIYALRELSSVINRGNGDSEEVKCSRVRNFYKQLPTSESVAIEVEDDEEGQKCYSIHPDIFLNELKSSDLLLTKITEEQLKGYGFTLEAFYALNSQVREYIEWGIKLYSMFKKLIGQFDIGDIDTSCCSILFCKALEMQVKECFYEGVKKQFPDDKICGPGNKSIFVKNAQKKNMMIGAFHHILHEERNKMILSDYMKKLENSKYDKLWWDEFDSRLWQGNKIRNECCHCNKFLWKRTNEFLKLLFLKDETSKKTIMDGLIRDCEVGRLL